MTYRWFTNPKTIVLAPLLLALVFILACGGTAATPVVVEKEVIREVIKEVPVEVVKEVEKQVVVEVVKEVEKVVERVVIATAVPVVKAPAKVVPTGTLKIAMTTLGTQTFDPLITTITGSHEHMTVIHENFIGGNTTLTEIGNAGGITDTWEATPDGKEVILHLKKNITFQDGSPITAEDVKFSWERVDESYVNSTSAGRILRYYDVHATQVLDPLTVKIVIKEPNFLSFNYLTERSSNESMVVPKAYIERVGPEKYNIEPIGAGPYRMRKHVPGVIVLEAVDNHFNAGVPRWKEMKFIHTPEKGTRIALLQTGEADIIEIAREDIPGLTKDGFNIWTKTLARSVSLFFYEQWREDNIVANPKVRQAILHSIDKGLILEALFGGLGELFPHRLANSKDLVWEDHEVFPDPYPYDPAKARTLLAEAGYPDGFDLNVYNFPRPGVAEIMKIGEAMLPMLEDVGINAKYIPMDWGAFRPIWISHTVKNPAISPHAHGVSLTDTMGFVDCNGKFKSACDPVLQPMIEFMQAAPSEAIYKDRKWEPFLYASERAMVGMLFNTDVPLATSPQIQAWELGDFGTDDWNLKWLAAEDSKRGW